MTKTAQVDVRSAGPGGLPVTDESGTDIGRYHLLAKLGEGGMGSVYVAEHKLMRKRVAVKMMHAAIGSNSAPLTRFINEARAAARVHHPGVIEIFDCDFDNHGRVYQAMELLQGESLRDFLDRHGPLSAHPQLLRRIGRDVAVAVGAAHAAGIIHRDLKPDNLFLSVHADGSSAVDMKVLDFGVAKLTADLGLSNADLTQAGARIGTILYMAPEQSVDAGRVDGRADIYALGCILYEMVAGRTPLSESDGWAVLAARLTRAPQPLRELAPDVDSSLEALVMSLLARDPADRPRDMNAVAAALAQGLSPATLSGPITLPLGLRVDVPDRVANPRPRGEVAPLVLPNAAAATRLRQEEPEPNGADPRVRLPAQPTSFVGREGELVEARRLFARTRLLTLVGPGGIGKTRLALELAAQVSGEFPGGVTFVPLASITDPELVAPAIVESLELEPGPVPARERLVRHLAGRTALLVLDNFEQVLGAAALVSALIRECPALKVVVSSRACLSISGEQEMPVPPLELPDSSVAADEVSNFESVRLFVARVLATKPSFEITPDSVAAIAEICVRLDGLPLAIELAAAWAKLIPPAAILDRLRRRLDLRSNARDIPARQRTIRATIDWSHDLLDDAAKRLFARLAVFCVGATLDDVEAVCADGPDENLLDALGTLVEHSLVRQQDEANGSRLIMLETIREYALERLAEGPDEESMRRRHALRYLALAEDARPHLVRVERRGWLARLDREHDNLRATFDTCMTSGRIEEALRLVAALWRFWQFRGHHREGRQRVERALADPASKAHPRAREPAVEGAGGLAYWLGDMSAMVSFYEECLELARANGDPMRISNALYSASFRWLMADKSTVEERASKVDLCTSEGLTLARGAGDRAGIARCLWARAIAATHLRSDDVAALKLLAEAIELFREEGDLFGLAWALHSEGMAHLRARDLARAGAALREAVSLLGEARDPMGAAIVLGDEAQLALASADRVRAVRLAAASAALRQLTGSELGSLIDGVEGRAVHATEADLGAWNEGLAMTFDDAISYALERIG